MENTLIVHYSSYQVGSVHFESGGIVMHQYNILVAGVGGLGVITATRLIAEAALIENKNAIMSEIHGLSQRYGTVTATLRIGDVYSPLIKKGDAHLIIGLEPIEALRNIYMLRKNGYVILNLNPIPPPSVAAGLEEYPPLEEIIQTIRKITDNLLEINALEIANQLGAPILQNTILIGVAFKLPNFPLNPKSGVEAIKRVFAGKEKAISLNIKAFEEGLKIAEKTLIKAHK